MARRMDEVNELEPLLQPDALGYLAEGLCLALVLAGGLLGAALILGLVIWLGLALHL